MTAITPGGPASFFARPCESPATGEASGAASAFALLMARALGQTILPILAQGAASASPAVTGEAALPLEAGAETVALDPGSDDAATAWLESEPDAAFLPEEPLGEDAVAVVVPGLAAAQTTLATVLVPPMPVVAPEAPADRSGAPASRPMATALPADGLLPAEAAVGESFARMVEEILVEAGLAPEPGAEAGRTVPAVQVVELIVQEAGTTRPGARSPSPASRPTPEPPQAESRPVSGPAPESAAPESAGRMPERPAPARPPTPPQSTPVPEGRPTAAAAPAGPGSSAAPPVGVTPGQQAATAGALAVNAWEHGAGGSGGGQRARTQRSLEAVVPPGEAAAALGRPGMGSASMTVDGTVAAAAPLAPEPATAPVPQSRVTLQLGDEEGGRAAIRIAVRGDSVRATIVAEDPVTAHRLAERVGDLEKGLRQQGFTEAQVRVERARGGEAHPLAWAGPSASGESSGRSLGGRGQDAPAEDRRQGEREGDRHGGREEPRDRSQQRSRRERQR